MKENNNKNWALVNKVTGDFFDMPDMNTAINTINEQETIFDRDHRSPFGNYYQVNRKYFQMFEDLIRDNPTSALLLQFLLNNMDGLNAVTCSIKVLCECLNYSPATIYRALKHLKENGYICTKKNGVTNVYIVNPSLFWSSWAKNLQYCEYNSDVIIVPSKKLRKIRRRKVSSMVLKAETEE